MQKQDLLELDTKKMNEQGLRDYIQLLSDLEDHEKFNSIEYLTPNAPQKRFWAMGAEDFPGDDVNVPGEKSQRAFFARTQTHPCLLYTSPSPRDS